MSTLRARVALVGVHGFGESHLENLRRLEDRVDLVAAADMRAPVPGTLPDTTRFHTHLEDLLDAERNLDAVIIATPMHTHLALGIQVVERGIDLYLEKPPVPTVADLAALCDARRGGAAIQVGFQNLGSDSLSFFDGQMMGSDPIRSIGAISTRWRAQSYWKRSAWSGRRTLDGRWIGDGAAVNGLAHTTMQALRVAGALRPEDVAGVDADLYRAQDIEGEDTALLRIRTAAGITITAGLTACARNQAPHRIIVKGAGGTAQYAFADDAVDADGQRHVFGRVDLFEDLLDSRRNGKPLRSDIEHAGGFVAVLEAMRAVEPRVIDTQWVDWLGGDDPRVIVRDIESWIERAVLEQATFAEIGAPWAAGSA